MPVKRTRLYDVVRVDWFGDCDTVVSGLESRSEANAKAAALNRESRAVDDPADKIKYVVEYYDWVREV